MLLDRTRAYAISLLALTFAAGPALGQDVPWLTPGQTVQGALEEGDARAIVSEWRDEAQFYDDYMLRAEPGERYLIALDSDDFDSYLDVYVDGTQDDLDPAFSDDDGGGYPNALLRFSPEQPGVYRVRVRGFSTDADGAYTLSVTERAPVAPEPAATRIETRGRVSGELTDDDPQLAYDEPYDVYVFHAQEGDRIDIRLNSDDFDPILYLGQQAPGGVFEELAVNDDGDDGLNSLLRFIVRDSGDYVIRAASLGASGRGAYELILEDAPPPRDTPVMTLDQAITGNLTSDASSDLSGELHDPYRFTAREGQRVAISLSSDDFDPVVNLGREGVSEFELIASDDDGGEGLNSRLEHVFEEAGDYIIQATSFGRSGTGRYTLRITEVAPPPPPSPLGFGETVQGRITEDSPTAEYGRRYDAYLISGREGQRVQATLRSGDFDAYLELGEAGETFEALASDDDGLGEGLNSRLNFTLPSTGDYVLRASPLGSSGRGAYALELADRGRAPRAGSISIGATVRGTLAETDNIADGDNSYYDEYRLRAREGDRLRITMVSNEFDAFLILGKEDEAGFVMITSDDDGYTDTNAMIETEIEETGWYVIRTNSYAPNSTGAYALTVERRE